MASNHVLGKVAELPVKDLGTYLKYDQEYHGTSLTPFPGYAQIRYPNAYM